MLLAAQIGNPAVELCSSAYMAAVKRVNVPPIFKDLGYLNPANVKLRVPFQFMPPVEVVCRAAAPKHKPRAAPKQLSMAAFPRKINHKVDKVHVFGNPFHNLEIFI